MESEEHLRLLKVQKQLPAPPQGGPGVVVLSDSETAEFCKVLEAMCFEAGWPLTVSTPGFDVVTQSLLNPSSECYQDSCSYIVLMPTTPSLASQALGRNDTSLEAQWSQLETAIEKVLEAKKTVFLCNLQPPIENEFGNISPQISSSLRSAVNSWNEKTIELCRRLSGVYLVDIERLVQLHGLLNWFDARLWFHAKYFCHPRFLPSVGGSIVSLLSHIQGQGKKCIVVDLDNTLWGGVLGDCGPTGLAMGKVGEGQPFHHFQKYLLSLKSLGYLLAISSKNYEAKAKDVFDSHPEMLLAWDDFAAVRVNWEDKATNISSLARELNLSTEAFVFIDDNPAERDLVRTYLPEVCVPEIPEDPAEVVGFLSSGRFFESLQYSEEDKGRTEMYHQEKQRAEKKSEFVDLDSFLDSLKMRATIDFVDEESLDRCAQLVQRSNQFNLRTQRLGARDLIERKDGSGSIFIRLEDKFGDLGIVSVASFQVTEESLNIREWVMSCRVLKRGVEGLIISALSRFAVSQGCTELHGEYLPTKKNELVKGLYSELGFSLIAKNGEETSWRLDLRSLKSKDHKIVLEDRLT